MLVLKLCSHLCHFTLFVFCVSRLLLLTTILLRHRIEQGTDDGFFFLIRDDQSFVDPSIFSVANLLWDWNELVRGQSKAAMHEAIEPLTHHCPSMDFLCFRNGKYAFDRTMSESAEPCFKKMRTTANEASLDWALRMKDVILFRGEEQENVDDLLSAVDELKSKTVWSPEAVGDLGYLLRYALAETRFHGLYPVNGEIRTRKIGKRLILRISPTDLLLCNI